MRCALPDSTCSSCRGLTPDRDGAPLTAPEASAGAALRERLASLSVRLNEAEQTADRLDSELGAARRQLAHRGPKLSETYRALADRAGSAIAGAGRGSARRKSDPSVRAQR
jgi:hypothetical protein